MSEDNPRYFRRFLAYALEYRVLLAIAVTMGLLKFVTGFAFPWLIGTAIDRVIQPAHGPVDAATRMHWLEWLLLLGVIFSIAHGVGTFGRGYFTARLGNRVIADLRQDLFEHLHRLSLHFYSRERTGSIISRLINDIQQASQLINGGVVAVIMDCTSLFMGLWLLFALSWKIAVAGLALMPLYALTYKILNPRVRTASQRVQSQISKISGNAQERLAGIALVKTYAAERRESEKFQEDTEEHYERVVTQSSLSSTVNGISDLLVHLGTALVIGVGGYLAIFGTPPMTAGQLTKALGYLAVMYLPVRRFAEVNVVYQTSLAAIERVFQVFDITPKIVEKPTPMKDPPKAGAVRFEAVWFDYHDESDESKGLEREAYGRVGVRAYGSRSGLDAPALTPIPPHSHTPIPPARWVLRNLDFAVEPGMRMALVGPSGSGKSTLVSLLPRLYDVARGRILIDGIDVRDYRLRALRRSIGIVQQDSFLFSGTIRENIVYGRPKATDDEVLAAAKAANAHEFITHLPDGYDSPLGERGVNLSGGQRQRLSIARAILKNPRILILDEATSALDSESEALVQEALDRLMRDRTCFIIAHRLSTVRHADRILVLQAGQIAETGQHTDLLEQNGLYARLVRQQFGVTTASPQAMAAS